MLGVTGAPGAGKSTLIHALARRVASARGQRVAVVAVDPSSPITGGAVLGDRVRMGEHGAHPRRVHPFARLARPPGRPVAHDRRDRRRAGRRAVSTPSSSRPSARASPRSRSSRLADTRVVVCPPGLGDDVQAIKAGILEIADVLVVTKGDLPAADVTVRDLEDMLRLRRPVTRGGYRC